MKILHILSYGLEHEELFWKIWDHWTHNLNDSLLLIHNGVYCGLNLFKINLPKNLIIYALKRDLIARGLLHKFKQHHNIKIITYSSFVNLIIQYDKSISW